VRFCIALFSCSDLGGTMPAVVAEREMENANDDACAHQPPLDDRNIRAVSRSVRGALYTV